MHLHRSNRVERLLDALAIVLERPLSDPFAAEVITVQSRGMERWLGMQLCARFGVFANARFPFPRHVLDQAFDAALEDPPELLAPFQPEALVFAIAGLLRERLSEPAFAEAARYLKDDEDGALRLGLASKLARLIDDYAVYRPELVLGWERGEEPGELQAELLRALVARHGRGHYAARAERFGDALKKGKLDRSRLPERVCWFGVASLPPLHVQLVAALSKHVETHLFVLTPSQEYFGDLPAGRGRGRMLGSPRASELVQSADADVQGHPLIGAFGRLGRDFQELLLAHAGEVEEDDPYEEPGRDTLLHALQSDMLHLQERAPEERLPIAPEDRSISIHSCHGPMREVEVLHDQIARLLEDESLEPHDIVVMTPDIETYAPVIDAVFGSALSRVARPAIPYAVAHRAVRPESPVVDALHAALDVLQSRVTAREVLDLLSREPVRARAGLEPEDLEPLRSLVLESGIRAGVDEAHRAELGLPAHPEGTFRFGLERMLLGYALEADGQRMFAGRLPVEIDGTDQAELAGALSAFCERVLRHRLTLRERFTLAQWTQTLEQLLDDLVGTKPAVAAQRSAIRTGLAELCEQAAASGFDEPIGLRALRPKLETALDARAPARGFLSRGVTFCQLEPMRGIPFEAVCLLGMNDETFPSRTPMLAFDRMQQSPRRGDRAPREDDRHVFLEALLCARRELIITYVGKGAHDDRVMPPAVVVSDLLDAIARGFVVEHGASNPREPKASRTSEEDALRQVEQRLVVSHRLHPFSPRYFEGGALFSYSTHDCIAAAASREPPVAHEFFDAPLPIAPLTELSIERLFDYLTRPTRTLVQRELGVLLGRDADPLPEREQLMPGPLDRWSVGQDALELLLAGVKEDKAFDLLRATGKLPPGAAGQLAFEEAIDSARAIAEAKRRRFPGAPARPRLVEVEVASVKLHGTLRNVWKQGLLEVSFSKLGKRAETRAFVQHVLVCAANEQGAGLPDRTVVIGQAPGGAEIATFGPVQEPKKLLASWIEIVREAQTRPMPVEHDASRAYIDALHAQKTHEQARKAACKTYGDEDYGDYVGSVADMVDDPRFKTLSGALFVRLLEHRLSVESEP